MKSRYIILTTLLVLGIIFVIWPRKTSLVNYLPSQANQKTLAQAVDWNTQKVDRIEVYKARRELVLRDQRGEAIKTYRIRLGWNPKGHKTQEGDGRTPEGIYQIDWRNPNSKLYRSLHISYPNAADSLQAKQRNVSVGGDIMIHGSYPLGPERLTGHWFYNYLPRSDWTLGCIALSNQDMDELWEHIKLKTTITIYP